MGCLSCSAAVSRVTEAPCRYDGDGWRSSNAITRKAPGTNANADGEFKCSGVKTPESDILNAAERRRKRFFMLQKKLN